MSLSTRHTMNKNISKLSLLILISLLTACDVTDSSSQSSNISNSSSEIISSESSSVSSSEVSSESSTSSSISSSSSSSSTSILEWLYTYDFEIPSPLYFAHKIKTTVDGYDEYKINWSSNNSPYLKIENDYILPRSVSVEQTVTLRGQINVDGKVYSRDFKVNIPKDSDPILSKNGLPIININTYGQGVNSNVVYTTGTFSMSRSQAYTQSYGVEESAIQIRLRGNSTMLPNKKAYRIKFDVKQSLFGMEACKSWVLLAEYFDETGLRNASAFTLAQKLNGLDFSPRAYHVEVYLNNEYKGIYLLTDQVQVNESRVNIYHSANEDDTGYLFYWDVRAQDEYGAENNVTYVTGISGVPMEFKTPERLTLSQRNFIYNYVKTAYDLLNKSTRKLSEYSQYIDIDAAIDYIIVNEIFKTQDIALFSVYMHKDKGGKLEFGPVWDFDLSSGNVNYIDRALPNYWFTAADGRNIWLHNLMKCQEFRVAFQNRWSEIRTTILPTLLQYIAETRQLIYKAAVANDALYPERNGDAGQFGNPPHTRNYNTYNQYTDYLYDWLNASLKFLDTEVMSSSFTQSTYANTFTSRWDGSKQEVALSTLPKFIQ